MKIDLNKDYNAQAQERGKYVDEELDLADTGVWGGQPIPQLELIELYKRRYGTFWGKRYLIDCNVI